MNNKNKIIGSFFRERHGIYKNKKNILFWLKLFLFLTCISFSINKITNLKLLTSNLESKNELLKNEDSFHSIIYKLKKLKEKRIKNNPIVSIISPIYNRERYILRFLLGIQYQNFKELEIILVDDYSKDNGVKLINEYKKKEKRIKLIKNIINKGTFICRNIGILFSKGKYIVLQDPDDILSKNIINLCYTYAEKYSYEIIRFGIYFGKQKKSLSYAENKFGNRYYQPELSTFLFYGNNNELEKIDLFINNKFIKRDVYIKALNLLKKYYLNKYIIFNEDQLLIFLVYKTANSFFYLKKIGYYYISNSNSITNNEKKIIKLRLKFIFIYLNFVFDYSKNNKYEKDISNSLLTNYIKSFNIYKILLAIKNDLKFFKDIINKYLNSPFITDENKNILKKLKKLIYRKKKFLLNKRISIIKRFKYLKIKHKNKII